MKAGNDGVTMKAKGISLKQTDIQHQNYLDVYHNSGDGTNKIKKVNQSSFRSVEHQIYTVNSMKCALSYIDDKRFWVEKHKSVVYGHYKYNELINKNL